MCHIVLFWFYFYGLLGVTIAMRTVSVNFHPKYDENDYITASRSFPEYGYSIHVTWPKSFDRHDKDVLYKWHLRYYSYNNEIDVVSKVHLLLEGLSKCRINLNHLAHRVIDCLLMEPSFEQLLEIISITRAYNLSLQAIEFLRILPDSFDYINYSQYIMNLVLFECKFNDLRYFAEEGMYEFFERFFSLRGFRHRAAPKISLASTQSMIEVSQEPFNSQLIISPVDSFAIEVSTHQTQILKSTAIGAFPSEILIHIYKNVDAFSLLECRLVCKMWKETYDDIPSSVAISDEEVGNIFWPLAFKSGDPILFNTQIASIPFFEWSNNQMWRLAFRLFKNSPFAECSEFYKFAATNFAKID